MMLFAYYPIAGDYLLEGEKVERSPFHSDCLAINMSSFEVHALCDRLLVSYAIATRLSRPGWAALSSISLSLLHSLLMF